MTARRTNDANTHVIPLRCDWAIVFRVDHGRLYVELIRGDAAKPRFILTSPIDLVIARGHVQRLTEILALAPSTKRSA